MSPGDVVVLRVQWRFKMAWALGRQYLFTASKKLDLTHSSISSFRSQ